MIDWALIVAFVCHVERNQKPSTICYFASSCTVRFIVWSILILRVRQFLDRILLESKIESPAKKKAILCFIMISQIQVI